MEGADKEMIRRRTGRVQSGGTLTKQIGHNRNAWKKWNIKFFCAANCNRPVAQQLN